MFHVQVIDLVSIRYEFLMVLTIQSSQKLYEKYSFFSAPTEIVLIGSFFLSDYLNIQVSCSRLSPPCTCHSALLCVCVLPHFVMQTFSVYLIAVNACCASIRMKFNSYFGSWQLLTAGRGSSSSSCSLTAPDYVCTVGRRNLTVSQS